MLMLNVSTFNDDRSKIKVVFYIKGRKMDSVIVIYIVQKHEMIKIIETSSI